MPKGIYKHNKRSRESGLKQGETLKKLWKLGLYKDRKNRYAVG